MPRSKRADTVKCTVCAQWVHKSGLEAHMTAKHTPQKVATAEEIKQKLTSGPTSVRVTFRG